MRRLGTRRMIIAGSVASLIVGLGVAAIPTAAAARPAKIQLDSFTLLPGVLHLTSNTHKHLSLSVVASHTVQSGETFSNADVQVSSSGTPEVHGWSFTLTNNSFTFDPATGKGSLKSGKQLKPFGAVNLTFSPAGKKHVTTHCQTFESINQPVKVKGSVAFNTRSSGKHKWGKVAKHGKFGGNGSVQYEKGQFASCGGGGATQCFGGTSWSASKSGSTGVNEVSIAGTLGKPSHLFATRNTSLKKPKNAIRSDTVNVVDKHMSFSVKGGKATVKVGAQGKVSGSATLAASSSASKFPVPCGKNGKTENTSNWEAPYKNGKSPLTAHEQIEGGISLPSLAESSHQASIDKTTVS